RPRRRLRPLADHERLRLPGRAVRARKLADDAGPGDVGAAVGADGDVAELDVVVGLSARRRRAELRDRDRCGARDEVAVTANGLDLRAVVAKRRVLVVLELRPGDPDDPLWRPADRLRPDEHP